MSALPNGNGGGIGPKTKVSLGTLAGFLIGAVTVGLGLYYFRAFEIAAARVEQDSQTLMRRDLDQARTDIVSILQWQRDHSDFTAESVRALNNNFEVLRLGAIQSLEYQQRDAETKHIRPPTIPGRLYEPMLLPSPSGIRKPVGNSLRDLIREHEARKRDIRETSGGGGR